MIAVGLGSNLDGPAERVRRALEAIAVLPMTRLLAHSALYDTERTAELFCWMVNRWKDLGGWPLASND